MLEPLKQHLDPLVGKGFRHILIDSYEAGEQNWNANFREDFKRLKGYDPLPWLMTMNAVVTEALLQRGEGVADFLALDHAPAGADAIPRAALLHGELRVADGVIVLPSGRRYLYLQLPPGEVMLSEVARALKQLVTSGATIVGPQPVRSPSLSGFPAADAEVRKIGEELWGKSNGGTAEENKVGAGRVSYGKPDAQAKALNLTPPVTVSDGSIRTTARKDGETDIFFVANLGKEAREFNASFRVAGKLPEVWQAEDGSRRSAAVWKSAGARTDLSLRLNAHQSIFVIFRKPAPADHAVEIVAADKSAAAFVARVDEAGRALVRSAGPCRGEIGLASGKRVPFAIEAVAPIAVTGPWKVAFAPGLRCRVRQEGNGRPARFPNRIKLVRELNDGLADTAIAALL